MGELSPSGHISKELDSQENFIDPAKVFSDDDLMIIIFKRAVQRWYSSGILPRQLAFSPIVVSIDIVIVVKGGTFDNIVGQLFADDKFRQLEAQTPKIRERLKECMQYNDVHPDDVIHERAYFTLKNPSTGLLDLFLIRMVKKVKFTPTDYEYWFLKSRLFTYALIRYSVQK